MILLRLIKRGASLGIVVIAIASVAATSALAVLPQANEIVTAHEGTSAEVELGDLAERSSVYAADGSFITVLAGAENREPIDLDDVPQEVIDAILTIEDADFYEHDGVNLRGTLRALVENVNAGGIEQGGSTITQQLVKLSLLSPDQNLERKATEAFYALRLEREMSKDAILERYLNEVFFGSSAYGIQAAAETYWGYESASQLGWAEAALLAGIIREPARFDPTNRPDEARRRRAVVLNRLAETGHITQEEADRFKLAPLPAERQEPISTKPRDYFVEEALQQLLNKNPELLGGDYQDRFNQIYRGGLQIYTTIDPEMQAAAERARNDLLPETEDGFTVAIATVDSKTGAVRALVGGPDFELEQFNLATDGDGRQPGSSMKTFVLAALFEAGYEPNDVVRADTLTLDDPTQPNGIYEPNGCSFTAGRQSLTRVTQSSNNCAFVRLGQVIGNDVVVNAAERLGITTLPEGAGEIKSFPLGSNEVLPLEMAGAYAAFANDGEFNRPWFIERIEDRHGNVLYEKDPDDWTRAVSQNTSRLVAQVLEANVRSGTGTAARVPGHAAAGKTGTTNRSGNAWFVGFTDYYSTAVWLGHPDDNRRIRIPGWNSFGGGLPAAIWGQFMTEIHEDLEPVPFGEPDPLGRSNYIKLPGEPEPCNIPPPEGEGSAPRVIGTEGFDRDGDGIDDCVGFIYETTTTTEPTTTTTTGIEPTVPTLPPTLTVPPPTVDG